MIHVLKVIVGRESVVAEAIEKAAKNRNLDIKAIFYTQEMKGYVFVEGNKDQLMDLIKEIQPIRGYLQPTTLEELKKYLFPQEAKIEIDIGDIVEVIGGPFKGERGRVSNIDFGKREITIDFLESAVPLPLTLSFEMVRVVEKAKK